MMLGTFTAVRTHTDIYVNTNHVDFGRICTEIRVLSLPADLKNSVVPPWTQNDYRPLKEA